MSKSILITREAYRSLVDMTAAGLGLNLNQFGGYEVDRPAGLFRLEFKLTADFDAFNVQRGAADWSDFIRESAAGLYSAANMREFMEALRRHAEPATYNAFCDDVERAVEDGRDDSDTLNLYSLVGSMGRLDVPRPAVEVEAESDPIQWLERMAPVPFESISVLSLDGVDPNCRTYLFRDALRSVASEDVRRVPASAFTRIFGLCVGWKAQTTKSYLDANYGLGCVPLGDATRAYYVAKLERGVRMFQALVADRPRWARLARAAMANSGDAWLTREIRTHIYAAP